MEQLRSTPVDWVGQEHLGFVINAAFSEENTRIITTWLDGLRKVAPEGVYCMEPEGLHITVLDWVAPLFDYGGADKHELYASLYESYDATFRRITTAMRPFEVRFNELRVTPGTIILLGQDDGQFASLRSQFTGSQLPLIFHVGLVNLFSVLTRR